MVIVPTKYYATPTRAFREAGISIVIWANHKLRAAITAMRDEPAHPPGRQSWRASKDRVARVKDIFRLAGNDELKEAEKRYLPVRGGAKAIVLAASRGDARPLTESRPNAWSTSAAGRCCAGWWRRSTRAASAR